MEVEAMWMNGLNQLYLSHREHMCGDRLCKYIGCKMNNKQGVIVSCWVNVCKVQEEVDNDLGQFVLS